MNTLNVCLNIVLCILLLVTLVCSLANRVTVTRLESKVDGLTVYRIQDRKQVYLLGVDREKGTSISLPIQAKELLR